VLRRWVVLLGLFGACYCASAYRAASSERICRARWTIAGRSEYPLCSSQIISTVQGLSRRSRPVSVNSRRAFSAWYFVPYAFIAPSGCSAISTTSSPRFRQTQNNSMIWLPWSGGRGWNLSIAGIFKWSEPGRLSFVPSPKGSRTGPDFGNTAETALAPAHHGLFKWRRLDLNQRPVRYERTELPGCSTPLRLFVSRNPKDAQPQSIVGGGLSCPLVSDDSIDSNLCVFETRRVKLAGPQPIGVSLGERSAYYYTVANTPLRARVYIMLVLGSWTFPALPQAQNLARPLDGGLPQRIAA
jgi:hypothetical protein